MEEDVEIDLLLQSNEDIFQEAAYSTGSELNAENSEIDESLIQTAKIIPDGLDILVSDDDCSSAKSLKRKNNQKRKKVVRANKKRKKSHGIGNENNKRDKPLDELQQQLDNHMISLIAKEPKKHVFPQEIYSGSESDNDDSTRNSKCFINEFTADDELPYRGTFIEEIRRQVGNKGKKQLKGVIFKELNYAQRLLLKRDELLTRLEVKLQEDISVNKERQNQTQEAIAMLTHNDLRHDNIKQPCYTRNFFKKFGIPYFEDLKGFTCAPNEDVIKKNTNKQLNLLSIPRVYFWSKRHNDLLIEGIRSTLIEEQSERLTKEILKLKEALKNEKNAVGLAQNIQELQQELIDVKKQSYSSLASKENPDREYDWMKYSATNLDGVHSSDECRRFWHTYLKPSINKAKWTSGEDFKLVELVEQMNGQDWDSIARLLGTNRTAFQCFIHYQTRIDINRQYALGRWTKDEDENLKKIVNISRHGDYIPWTKVAAHFPHRSHYQLYTRWKNSLDPKLVKGRFSKEEDVLVVAGIEVFGANYSEVASLMENRSVPQIRDRYERHLIPKTSNIGTWSLKEDAALLKLVKTYGRNWVEISKLMVTRSRTQVRQRYNTIQHMMKVKPGWTIEKSRRIKHSVDLGKSLKRTWRLVERIKKEMDTIEKSFNLSSLEKETFRLEKLRELKDSIMLKKFYPRRKKRALSENAELSKRFIEYFQPSYPNTIFKPHLRHRNKINSQAYLNEMLVITRHLGHELDLPTSIEEVMLNPRLNPHLKNVLSDAILNQEKSKENLTEKQPEIAISLMNINYEPPPNDETIISKEWWFSPPFDISRLNFAELFKRTVFDYSSGMHKDIWSSKVTRECTTFKPFVQLLDQDRRTYPSLPLLIPPNIVTAIALRTLVLSRSRLKKNASGRGFSKVMVKTSFPTPVVTDSIEAVDIQEEQTIPNVEDAECQRNVYEEIKTLNQITNCFHQTLETLCTWPKILSLVNLSSTPYSKQHSYFSLRREANYAASKVLSLINEPKEWSDNDSLELKKSHEPLHDLASNKIKNVFKRNVEVKRRILAHQRGNKCLRKVKIEHLLKEEHKKEPLQKTRKIKKSKTGLHPNQRVINRKLKKVQPKCAPVEEMDLENNENFSVMLPELTYQKKTRPNLPSCSSTQNNQETEIFIREN